jgi:hypothetical protein
MILKIVFVPTLFDFLVASKAMVANESSIGRQDLPVNSRTHKIEP